MKSLEEILENYDKYQTFIEDRLGRRLCQFLTVEQMEKIGWEFTDEEAKKNHQPIEWNEENVLAQLSEDVAFGFDKALDQRGISASMMYEVVLAWNKILEDGLEDWDEYNYAMYGLPLFKATAVKYGFDNPIGDDNGDEEYYDEEYEY